VDVVIFGASKRYSSFTMDLEMEILRNISPHRFRSGLNLCKFAALFCLKITHSRQLPVKISLI